MLNIPELERRWLRYKIKSLTPYAIAGISIIVIATYVFFNSQNEKVILKTSTSQKQSTHALKQNLHVEKNTTIQKTQEVSHTTSLQPKQPVIKQKEVETITPLTAKVEKSKTILRPSMNFLHNIDKPSNITDRDDIAEQEPINQEEVKEVAEDIMTPQAKITSSHILIKRRDTNDDIKEIVKRFKKNNNPALSLFIAKKYYEMGDYKKAYNYALITNNINSDIEESWIVFSKSLVKMGKRDIAIKTLKKYINYSQSNTAQILLNEIQSGKFK
jgi:tetratricopeptide (TPR) repeat protein